MTGESVFIVVLVIALVVIIAIFRHVYISEKINDFLDRDHDELVSYEAVKAFVKARYEVTVYKHGKYRIDQVVMRNGIPRNQKIAEFSSFRQVANHITVWYDRQQKMKDNKPKRIL